MYDITVALAVFVSPVQYYCEAYGVTKFCFVTPLCFVTEFNACICICGVRLQGHSRGNRQNVEKNQVRFFKL